MVYGLPSKFIHNSEVLSFADLVNEQYYIQSVTNKPAQKMMLTDRANSHNLLYQKLRHLSYTSIVKLFNLVK